MFLGTYKRGAPAKSWPGVRTSESFGSSDKGINERELIRASTYHRRVDNSSNVTKAPLKILTKCCLVSFMDTSHKPPKFDA